ncbi:Uncharacterised protein [uncultured archaeon]|nr:Uncharacterised protein [uncultured archaeon]
MQDNLFFGDFHIHSRFSRACSTNITLENLAKWAKIKGIHILGTGDFTHPQWLKEIKEKLKEKNGFYYLDDFPFIITGEICLIYTQERGRRIHLVLLIPNLEIADKANAYLDTKGRRDYDGRPIFSISGDEFTREMMKISEDIEIIPAHAWTPWFGIFGSMSGFDSLKECFKEEIKNIHAIETGMSSDPEMNWRIEELKDKAIVSFSDAHSFWPFRLGREATIFKKTDSYLGIVKQIREKSFLGTIETDPAYGKYHWDGDRLCNFSCSPEESEKINGICPVCKKSLVIGVENRVEKLASHEKGFKPENRKKFYKLLPLHEILALALGTAMESKKVWAEYNSLIELFGNEFNILLDVSKEEFAGKNVKEKIIELILKNREEKIKVKPGYDGEYGVALAEEKQERLF